LAFAAIELGQIGLRRCTAEHSIDNLVKHKGCRLGPKTVASIDQINLTERDHPKITGSATVRASGSSNPGAPHRATPIFAVARSRYDTSSTADLVDFGLQTESIELIDWQSQQQADAPV